MIHLIKVKKHARIYVTVRNEGEWLAALTPDKSLEFENFSVDIDDDVENAAKLFVQYPKPN